MRFQPKPLFENRMRQLLRDDADYEEFLKYNDADKIAGQNFIRCNTLKISISELIKRLKAHGWKIEHPLKNFPQAIVVKSKLMPGEIGKATEHLLGYYYVQELSSMLPLIILKPKLNEFFLDLCAAPGSKTTQACAMMQNTGTVIANDYKLGRIKILASNTERCGCANIIITRNDGVQLCKKLNKIDMKFDKILVDAPCSGEGNLRISPKTFLMWNLNMIKKLSLQQKKLTSSAIQVLKQGGELLYSTCTHAPEENEEVVDFLVKNCGVVVENIDKQLPREIKFRYGITKWNNKKYNEQVSQTIRIYPQDNNTGGFFIAKLKKI